MPQPPLHAQPGPGLCPSCGAATAADAPQRPFCSVRCRWVDLGRWLDGSYRVPGRPGEGLPDEAFEAGTGRAAAGEHDDDGR
ncbi:MAG: DNA gyrase inhibitor YacG [Planctomycetia bacterium]